MQALPHSLIDLHREASVGVCSVGILEHGLVHLSAETVVGNRLVIGEMEHEVRKWTVRHA